jgi:hypothetical protein
VSSRAEQAESGRSNLKDSFLFCLFFCYEEESKALMIGFRILMAPHVKIGLARVKV